MEGTRLKDLTVVLGSLQVLPHDSKARRLFVTSGGLKKVQEIKADPGSPLQEYINSINNCYPEEIVRCVANGSVIAYDGLQAL